jgi:hypothetical protein
LTHRIGAKKNFCNFIFAENWVGFWQEGEDGEFENITSYLAALDIVIDRNMTGK